MSTTREETQKKMDVISAAVGAHKPSQTYSVADRFEQQVTDFGDRLFQVYEGESQTYAQGNAAANQLAHYGASQGLKQGDVAGLMMENRLEFISAWIGLAKLGVTIALINPNAREQALEHAIKVSGAALLFAGSECLENLATIPAMQGVEIKVIDDPLLVGKEPTSTIEAQNITSQLLSESGDNPDPSVRLGLVAEDPLFYIFTSGTTGLPKAARISHMRWLGVGDMWKDVMGLTPEDVFYCVLPMYHGAAGMSLASPAVAAGAAIILKRRFSASQFWGDVRKYNVTNCQYIGEICRYLLNKPAQANDTDNPLKRMVGAGLGAEIWADFQQRFGIEDIYEGWGSTESNCSTSNLDNKVGSCGRIPFKEKSNVRLVRYDVENDCHFTNPDGTLIECEAGEVGEAIGMIIDLPDVGAGRFEGYTDPKASEKKILRNVFTQGDAWFSSGDLLRRDEDDYYYFVDRIGDTYRWKSENVSTQEVAEALSSYSGLESINIYGVKVPGQEGRAGMAALVFEEGNTFNPTTFFEFTADRLPKYAHPLFVRVSAQTEMTATFKLRKVDLQKQGYDCDLKEPLFVRDEAAGQYVPLTLETLERLSIPAFEAS